MRAFTIRVDATSGVSGFLRPSDRVDVYWSGRSEIGEVTQLIEAGVRIIAIDQSADEDRVAPTIARTVTVQVDPQQAAGLAQAQATGKLSLSLVGAEEQQVAENVTINQRQLLGITGPAPVEQRKECSVRTKTRNGIRQHPDRVPDRIDPDMSSMNEARATSCGARFVSLRQLRGSVATSPHKAMPSTH